MCLLLSYELFRINSIQIMQSHAEADAFFCFVELLSGFRDFYCQQLDNSVVGIRSAITRLSQLVRKHDEELWRHLEITTKVRHCFLSLLSVVTTIFVILLRKF